MHLDLLIVLPPNLMDLKKSDRNTFFLIINIFGSLLFRRSENLGKTEEEVIRKKVRRQVVSSDTKASPGRTVPKV